jgi:DNA polymerase III subunit gamma/tau
MSTVVLARKYRPKSFGQMVGQEHVVRALSNALEQNRLHHAYLFTGTRGIGKTTVSRILAKSLNCTGPDGQGGVTSTPCGVCTACTEIDADRYMDYIELDAASNRSIDEIRDLIERAAYKPGIGRFKVFMIDEAHQLTKDAFNALLKTLEEPPEYLKFVLATTDPEKMLPTVLSRCLQFNLRPMAPEVVRSHLAEVLQAEGLPFEDAALRLLGRAARGSMRDALSLTDQAIAYGGGGIDEAGVRAMLGSVDGSHASGLVQALADRDGAAVLAGVATLRERGLSPGGTLEAMATLLQQMAVAQAVPAALDAADPDHADAVRLAPCLAADETQLMYSMMLHGRAELSLMSDEYAALTMVLLRYLAFPAAGSPGTRTTPAGPGHAAAPTPVAAAKVGTGLATAGAVDGISARRSAGTSVAPRAAPPASRTNPAAPTAAPTASPADRHDEPRAPSRPMHPSDPGPGPGSGSGSGRAPDADIPPWLDEGPPPDYDFEPRSAPLRASASSALAVPATRERSIGQDRAARVQEPLPRGHADGPDLDMGADDLGAGDDGFAAGPLSTLGPHGPHGPVSPASPLRSAPDLPTPPVTTALGDRWAERVQGLAAAGRISGLVRELAWQAGALACDEGPDGSVWTLMVERESLRSEAMRDRLAAALTAEAGASQRLELVPGVPSDSMSRRDAWERQRRQAEAEALFRNDPAVQDLLSQFKTARLVPGTIRPL